MTTALNHSKMKKYPHIFYLFFCLLLATTMNAQFTTPPDNVSGDRSGLEKFLRNGTIDLKDLNPANFINNKRRRFLYQQWTPQNTWGNGQEERIQFAANCGLPLQSISEFRDAVIGTLYGTSADTLIYVNNRLRTWNTYDVLNGVRSLYQTAQFTYSTRAAPDTVLVIKSPPFTPENQRYIYTFNASNQLTAIRQEDKVNNAFVAVERVQLTYDASGNLTRHLREKVNGANWATAEDNRYTYNTTNQLTEKVNISIFSGVTYTEKDTYAYDAQNRLTKLVNIDERDTTVYTLSNHNTKKRPRLIDVDGLSSTSPFLGKATLTYQANDSLVVNATAQKKTRVSDPFVNDSRYIFEYCGDAVATTEVKKESLSCLAFPNPASESLTIRLKEETTSNVDVSIVNTMGQVVLQARNRAVDTPLSITTLPNGLYVLKVQIGDKIGISPFTVLK